MMLPMVENLEEKTLLSQLVPSTVAIGPQSSTSPTQPAHNEQTGGTATLHGEQLANVTQGSQTTQSLTRAWQVNPNQPSPLTTAGLKVVKPQLTFQLNPDPSTAGRCMRALSVSRRPFSAIARSNSREHTVSAQELVRGHAGNRSRPDDRGDLRNRRL